MKQAVAAVIFGQDSTILGVAARGSSDAWGLPGGKAEPGETLVEALIREVKEETGCTIKDSELKLILTRIDGEFVVSTFVYQGALEETPTQGDAGPVKWVSWDELIAGPYGEYNSKVKEKLGL
jgi:8-oxo-dGTP pyrophosphatase MutT (NUDIX family)